MELSEPGRWLTRAKGTEIKQGSQRITRREKFWCMLRCPYRKPTQVDEERILRPTGEGLLRNSAKLPRNFGIRGALYGEPQRIGPSDCLPKTQVYAKSKDDVYGLTPARCWKVKRRA